MAGDYTITVTAYTELGLSTGVATSHQVTLADP